MAWLFLVLWNTFIQNLLTISAIFVSPITLPNDIKPENLLKDNAAFLLGSCNLANYEYFGEWRETTSSGIQSPPSMSLNTRSCSYLKLPRFRMKICRDIDSSDFQGKSNEFTSRLDPNGIQNSLATYFFTMPLDEQTNKQTNKQNIFSIELTPSSVTNFLAEHMKIELDRQR